MHMTKNKLIMGGHPAHKTCVSYLHAVQGWLWFHFWLWLAVLLFGCFRSWLCRSLCAWVSRIMAVLSKLAEHPKVLVSAATCVAGAFLYLTARSSYGRGWGTIFSNNDYIFIVFVFCSLFTGETRSSCYRLRSNWVPAINPDYKNRHDYGLFACFVGGTERQKRESCCGHEVL